MEDDTTTVKLFTQRMRRLRQEKGEKENRELTQVAVSKDLGIHVNTIRSYESSSLDMMPKIERLKKIKNYYNVSYEYLLGETDVKSVNEDMMFIHNETGLSEKSIEYLKTLDKDDRFLKVLNLLIEDMSKCDNKKEDNQ